ncbi:hypothetical protein [Dyadobacter sandarakinus]|uniref:Glycosyltransferase RgtA/B/C/D-like domain-containing protein n=1 Tax=Dyadobacter sandarakinus TaxID=2747268 RepID=A0ABX7IAJ0_9BACT|nr:hypothetical protein [Dyadobacter sandarakinus]QRR01971.1 hypothetical protein HWI92_14155 [Dyadobacter sandarakinus]
MKLFVYDPFLPEYFFIVISLLALFGLSFAVKGLRVLQKWSGIGLVVVPIIYFYIILAASVVNIPYTDDFNLLETIFNFQHTTGFLPKLKILFEQVNQHRFAFERLVMLLLAGLTGTVNIKVQVLTGNLFLLGILWLLFSALRKQGISWHYFIPVPYIIFNLVYYENALWGIAAIQNTPLIFFALLSAYGLGRSDGRGWLLGFAAALLATFTSGSGMLAWIIGALILILQKRYKPLAGWLITAGLIIVFYFMFSYQVIPSPGDRPWKHPLFNLIFILGFWGNALYLDVPHPLVPAFYPDLVRCVLLGAAMALVFGLWLIRLWRSKNLNWSDWFLWGGMMFMMGTGAMFIISRPIANYLMYGGNIFSRRYMIFGVVLLAVCYVAVIVLVKTIRELSRGVAVLSFSGILLLHFTSYYLSLVNVRKWYEDLVIDSYYWKNFSTFLTTGDHFGDIPFWNHPTRMKNLIANLDSSGLSRFYHSGPFPDHSKVLPQTAAEKEVYGGEFHLTRVLQSDRNNQPLPFLTFTAKDTVQQPGYFVLASPDHTILLPAVPVPHNPANLLRARSYYSQKVAYALFEQKLPKGIFKIWMMYPQANGHWKSVFTGKQVSLKGQQNRNTP